MIESRLDKATDGTGGGPEDGNLTVADIARQFRWLAAERRDRSISGILRIVREQSKSRRHHEALLRGTGLVLAFVATIMILFAISPDPRLRRELPNAILAVSLLAGPLAFLAFGNRRQAARSRAQLAEIRRLALEALEAIIGSPWFVPRPLDREEVKILWTLRKADPQAWDRVAWVLAGDAE